MGLNGNLGDECQNERASDASAASAELPQPKLLFALPHGTRPSDSLRSASVMAASMQAELHVLSMLPRLSSLCARDNEPFDVAEARRRIEECVDVCRQTRSWCEDMLGEPVALQRLRIRFGDPAEAIALRAAELDARLVVLAAASGALGPTALQVCCARSRPVLVARSFTTPGVVIAATDLEDNEYRVLREASALGAALGSRVVAVHNVSCLSTPLGACLDAGVKPVPELPMRMRAELPTPLDLVVTTEIDPVGAILEQARHHGSGVIVVGTRSRADRRFEPSVPSEIIDRSRWSVLVTSLGA